MSRQETTSGASNSQAPQNTIFIRTPLHPHHLPKLGWKDAQCLLALASHNLPPAHPRRDATVHWHVDAQQASVHTSRTLRPFVCRTLATCCPSSGSGRESSNAARTCFRYLLLRFTPDMVGYGKGKKVGTAGENEMGSTPSLQSGRSARAASNRRVQVLAQLVALLRFRRAHNFHRSSSTNFTTISIEPATNNNLSL